MERGFIGKFSQRGTPCLGVGGGALSNTVTGRMVLRSDGSKPHALFINQHGNLACSLVQAIVPVGLGDTIITFAGSLPAECGNPQFEVGAYIVRSIEMSEVGGERVPIFFCEPVGDDWLDSIFAWDGIPYDALNKYHNRDSEPFVD